MRIRLIETGFRYWTIEREFDNWTDADNALDQANAETEIALKRKHQGRNLRRFRYLLQLGKG